MTIAHIKSNALRRTLLVALVPFLPVIIMIAALLAALPAFWEELCAQSTQGGGGIWDSIKCCWRGDDANRRECW